MPSSRDQGVAVRGAGKSRGLAGTGVLGSRGAGDGAAWGGCASRRCNGPVKLSRMRAAVGRAASDHRRRRHSLSRRRLGVAGLGATGRGGHE